MRTLGRLGLLAAVSACASSTAAPEPTRSPPPVDAPPSPSATPASPSDANAVYTAWIRAFAGNPGTIREATLSPPSAWRFFYGARAPGDKQHPAAVLRGDVVHVGGQTGWDTLLREGTEAETATRLAWLLGSATALTPDSPHWVRLPPEAAAVVRAPERTPTEDGVLFVAWFADPPAFSPYRVQIAASPQHTTQTITPWRTVLNEPTRPIHP